MKKLLSALFVFAVMVFTMNSVFACENCKCQDSKCNCKCEQCQKSDCEKCKMR